MLVGSDEAYCEEADSSKGDAQSQTYRTLRPSGSAVIL